MYYYFITLLILVTIIRFSVSSIDREQDPGYVRHAFQNERSTAPASLLTTPYIREYPEKPPLTSRAELVLNLESGVTMLEEAGEDYWPIASITKLMTAVIVREKLGNNERIEINKEMTGTEGGAGNLLTGEVYSSLDLMKAMLLVSSNDAAEALARSYGREKFITLMNKKAHTLGMTHTSFNDPTGLSIANQSSLRDLVLFTKYVFTKHPEIFTISRAKSAVLEEGKWGRRNVIVNFNEFTGSPEWIGGKTGYLEESRGNLLSLFALDSEQFLIIVLGSENRFGDTRNLWEWTKAAMQ